MIEFTDFPMPPSDNELTRSSRNRWYSTPEYVAFKHQCLAWELANRAAIRECIKDLKPPLYVRSDFYFEKSKIVCKDGRTKRNDGPNRIKALHDAIAKIIKIDDCEIWEWGGGKRVSPTATNFVNVQIHHFDIETNKLI